MTPIHEMIVTMALNFLGQREISGNMGFTDSDFEKKMKAVGWEKGQAWCSYFAELVWKEAYRQFNPAIIPVLDKLFSALAVGTYSAFLKDRRFPCNTTPAPGCVVIWQNYQAGNPDWRGHAGIVIVPTPEGFISIEGNTNSSGGREGIEVAKKDRKIIFSIDNGLRLKGFIHPIETL